MYSHKRSFTGQSTRSIAALFDWPFLLAGVFVSALAAVIHSVTTYFSLHEHIRALPAALEQIPPATLKQILRNNTEILNLSLILTTWTGMLLPMLFFAIAIRWTLAPLRVTVQRTVILCCLAVFYSCSFMGTLLANPNWMKLHFPLSLFSNFGTGFFQSLRAILCASVFIAVLYTLTKNATSKVNRAFRITATALLVFSWIAADYVFTQNQRRVNPVYLKNDSSLQFIFILPGLKPKDVQESLRAEELTEIRNQISSFQEVHPSTPSLLGQLTTTLLGIEPNMHGIRHDFTAPEVLGSAWKAALNKGFTKGHEIFPMTLGGTSPLTSLTGTSAHGENCGQDARQLSKLGHFQASVISYSLTPRVLEPFLNRELPCSNRFLTLRQHLSQAYETITENLHSPGLKTFFIWISPNLNIADANLPSKHVNWDQPTKNIFEILSNHRQFLQNTKLINFHRTFVVGLAENKDTTTAFARFDGQIKAQLTDLTLDSPGQRSQLSVAHLLRSQQTPESKDSVFFYSEFTDSINKDDISKLAPDLSVSGPQASKPFKFIVNPDLIRKSIINSKRHVICQNVASTTGRRLLVKVSLNLRATENRLPQLSYEEFEKENLPSPENQMGLEDCLKQAREILTESVYKDVSLRDSSTFRTLLTGLPVRSIKTTAAVLETTSETENEAFDKSTSAVPESLQEEQDE
jgi:hypothetical protein